MFNPLSMEELEMIKHRSGEAALFCITEFKGPEAEKWSKAYKDLTNAAKALLDMLKEGENE